MPDIVLTLRPTPSADPDAGRLKAILKALTRRYGLTCIDIRDAPASDQRIYDRSANTLNPENPTVPPATGTQTRNRRPRNRSPYAT